MGLRLIAASKTDAGRERDQNEDACFYQISETEQGNVGLFIVADGMGGYHAGEVASEIAVKTISEALGPVLQAAGGQPVTLTSRRRGRARSTTEDEVDTSAQTSATSETDASTAEGDASGDTAASEAPDQGAVTQELSETPAVDYYGDQLRQAVQTSSEAIVKYGVAHREARGLGSTVTAMLIIGEHAFIANVGDSRTYLLRGGALERVTRDHSLVERLVEAGQIERESVYDHPSRNLIYRSLGAGHADVDVDIFTEQLRPGDSVLLCSDGLWEMVRDPQILRVLSEIEDPAAACDALIHDANENGGVDNISAVLVRCVAE